MVSFERFVQQDGVPIYLQIIRYIKQGIVAGTIQDGDEIPSRRVLSAVLGVNPNTVQKAYHLLEEEGLIASRSGAGSAVALTEEKTAAVRAELMGVMIHTLVDTLRGMGVSRSEALRLVGELWDKEEGR